MTHLPKTLAETCEARGFRIVESYDRIVIEVPEGKHAGFWISKPAHLNDQGMHWQPAHKIVVETWEADHDG